MWESRSKNHMEIFLHISLLFTLIFFSHWYFWRIPLTPSLQLLWVTLCWSSASIQEISRQVAYAVWEKDLFEGKIQLSLFSPAKQAEVVVISLWQSYLIQNTHPLFHSLIIKKYSTGLLPGRNSNKNRCGYWLSLYNQLLQLSSLILLI